MAGSYVSGLREVRRNIELLYAGERKAIVDAFKEIASLLSDWAKTHHEWMPRTGNTDASTRAEIVKAGVDEMVLELSAGMEYDQFLELAHSGRWAWLWPAMTANQERIFAILLRHGAVDAMGITAVSMSGMTR